MCHLEIREFVLQRLPEGWFARPPEIETDGEEILIVGELGGHDEASDEPPAARAARARAFREGTRLERMRIAQQVERAFGRKVSWGVEVAGERVLFTTLSIPVMTRLRLAERKVLDTLVAAGVARSRSDALAWCVRLVGRHEADWIEDLRRALVKVEELRRKAPH
jgi:hypothetical protein